ncbi:MAG: sigma factor-like helix-turn-helix DNA-binding protein [Patescibacteria group bacterium]
MDGQNSILDRVISSKQSTEIEQFNPSEVVSQLFKALTSREEDVLRRRHGLSGKPRETLEEIGATYSVTRERVRQIENTAISKIQRLKDFGTVVNPIESIVSTVLEQHGGIMSEEDLLAQLLQVVGDTDTSRHNILFIISELLDGSFKLIKEDDEFRRAWRTQHAPIHIMKEVIQSVLTIITEFNKPISSTELVNRFKQTEAYTRNQDQLNDDALISYVQVSQKISKNPFDEYGISEWGSIVPRRMNDKIYLVLKKNGKPMHFTEITKMINETKFDSRKAYPPTVHNELILNDQYVLVGRGIYALKEWGYKPGVVASVLIEILRAAGHPLGRDELVRLVLDQRMVKKNTVHLALTDKTKFKKLPDGTYTLV